QRRAAEQAAEQARQAAEEQHRRSEWLLYVNRIGMAQREWQTGNAASARELLEKCRWELRGWEYDYLHARINNRQRTLTIKGHAHDPINFLGMGDRFRFFSAVFSVAF